MTHLFFPIKNYYKQINPFFPIFLLRLVKRLRAIMIKTNKIHVCQKKERIKLAKNSFASTPFRDLTLQQVACPYPSSHSGPRRDPWSGPSREVREGSASGIVENRISR